MTETPPEAGKSSFDLLDPDVFFAALPLSSVRVALDLGCGVGRYAVPLARRLGPSASVRGFDLWEEGVETLNRTARSLGLAGLSAETADLSRLDGVPDGQADLALMATVLHDLAARGTAETALAEAARVLKPGGLLAVVEFKKVDARPGPPISIRVSPEELSRLVEPAGFERSRVTDLGQHLYLALYKRLSAREGRP